MNTKWHFAIIPHFMLDEEKVDQFYYFIKSHYASNNEEYKPDKIIIISFRDEKSCYNL